MTSNLSTKKRKKTVTENEAASLFYFEKVLPDDSCCDFKCKICPNVVRTMKPGSGFSNLFSHVNGNHPNYQKEMAAYGSPSVNQILNFFLPAKYKNIYSWLDWVIGEGLPFHTVEKVLTKKYSKLEPVSVKTLMKYIHKFTLQVEQSIKRLLPDKFCLLFDGWTLDGQSTQFIGIFATFMSNGAVEKVLLAFQPLFDESDFSAQSHMELLQYILISFGKDFTNLVCLIGDNCNTNIATAKLCGVPLIGIEFISTCLKNNTRILSFFQFIFAFFQDMLLIFRMCFSQV